MKAIRAAFGSTVALFGNLILLVAQPLPASYTSNLPFSMPEILIPTFPNRSVSITDFGARADGQTLNTKAFAEAISICAKAGGGQVIVPSGVWLTGPIRLQSNINLHLEKGALILFSKNKDDYSLIPMPTPASKNLACTPPIYGYQLENIAVTGEGIIDGSGEQWRPMKKEKYTASEWKRITTGGGFVAPDGKMWWPSQQAAEGDERLKSLRKQKKILTLEDFAGVRDFLRPNMVVLFNCKKVLLDGPTFRNSPKFNVNPVQCEDVVIRNVTIQNDWNAQNGDGLDIGSCHNVIVYNCVVDAGDDAICMKPGVYGKEKNWSAACENIVIADCTVYHGHGGFVIGSESYGGARNIAVRNCTFIGTDVGLRFKSSRDRGGLVENIYIENIRMKDIVREAMLFDMYYEADTPAAGEPRVAVPVGERTPLFHKFFIKDVVCHGADQAVYIQGLPEQLVREIELSNILISSKRGVTCIDAEGITFNKVTVLSKTGPVFNIDNAKNITISNPSFASGIEIFMKVAGKQSSGIQVLNADLSKIKKAIELDKDVAPEAVVQK